VHFLRINDVYRGDDCKIKMGWRYQWQQRTVALVDRKRSFRFHAGSVIEISWCPVRNIRTMPLNGTPHLEAHKAATTSRRYSPVRAMI